MLQMDKYSAAVFQDSQLYSGSKWLYLFLMTLPKHKYSGGFKGLLSIYREKRHMITKYINQLVQVGLIKKTKPQRKTAYLNHAKRVIFQPISYIALEPREYLDRQKRANKNANSQMAKSKN